MRKRRTMLLGGLAAAAGVLATMEASEAGIVVLEDGRTIVGTIEADDVGPEAVVVQDPAGEAGRFRVDRHRIRWFDREADAPTDAYWAAHVEEPIEPRWHAARERWLADREDRGPRVDPPPFDPGAGPRLSARPTGDEHFDVRYPRGWFASREDGITMIVSPRAGRGGYRPRIHVFSVVAPPGATADEQLEWIRAGLSRQVNGGEFAITERYVPRRVDGGVDETLVTRTRVAGREVVALRRVAFRAERVYFFAAYAAAADYPARAELFRECLETLATREDPRG